MMCMYIKIEQHWYIHSLTSKLSSSVLIIHRSLQRSAITMKFLLSIAAVVLFASAVYCVPLNEFEDLEDMEFGANEGVRQRRLTCDLLSPEINVKGFGGKVNHGACAANCLSMGKAGGRCNNGICQCRKTTFGDLWNKRFG